MDSVKKVGGIIFWRSESIYDKGSKKYWKPDISYDIYFSSDSIYVAGIANKIKLASNCNLINTGLETFPVNNPDFVKENFVAGWTYFVNKALKEYTEKLTWEHLIICPLVCQIIV